MKNNYINSLIRKVVKNQDKSEKELERMDKEFKEEWNKWGKKTKEKIKFL